MKGQYEQMLFDKSDDELHSIIYSGKFNDGEIIEVALEELKYRKAIKSLNNFSCFLDPEILKLMNREKIFPEAVNRRIRDEAVKRKLIVSKSSYDVPNRNPVRNDDVRRNSTSTYGNNNDWGYKEDSNRRNPVRNDDVRRNNTSTYDSNNDRGYNEDPNRNPVRNDDVRRNNNSTYGNNNDRSYKEEPKRNPVRNNDVARNNTPSYGGKRDSYSHNRENRNYQPIYQQSIVIVKKQKSLGVAFLLAFLFGPMGLLYSSVVGGVVMFFLAIPVVIFTFGLGLIFFIWPACVIWAIIATNMANNEIMSETRGNYNTNFRNSTNG
jgi:hypothetical protein